MTYENNQAVLYACLRDHVDVNDPSNSAVRAAFAKEPWLITPASPEPLKRLGIEEDIYSYNKIFTTVYNSLDVSGMSECKFVVPNHLEIALEPKVYAILKTLLMLSRTKDVNLAMDINSLIKRLLFGQGPQVTQISLEDFYDCVANPEDEGYAYRELCRAIVKNVYGEEKSVYYTLVNDLVEYPDRVRLAKDIISKYDIKCLKDYKDVLKAAGKRARAAEYKKPKGIKATKALCYLISEVDNYA